jgi:hypothetical protein
MIPANINGDHVVQAADRNRCRTVFVCSIAQLAKGVVSPAGCISRRQHSASVCSFDL